MNEISRRGFLQTGAAAIGASALNATAAASAAQAPSSPVAISSANGLRTTAKAVEMIVAGADTLDAAIAGVNIVEEDPEDHSVGYGGLPNEEGVVELDSSVMHGPTCRAGAVAALRNIKTPSQVAKLVMTRTDHVLIVGEGALRFARAHGFEEVNLLTDEARKIWLEWKERHSEDDDWLPPPDPAAGNKQGGAKPARFGPERLTTNGLTAEVLPFTYGTITCLALNTAGDISGVTTTSGLSYKIPGRVGDSPIIGAGLFVDNEVGACGSTGRGEAVLKICGSHSVVEAMRGGMAPQDACLHALKRIVATTKEARLLRKDGRPDFDVKFYALAKDGRFGAASIWSKAKFAVNAAGQNRLEECAYLFERPA